MNIKKLTETATVPTRATEFAAGFDLYADSVDMEAWGPTDKVTNFIVHTGISMEIPHGYVGLIFARSSLACHHGLRPANCVGVIDEDYRGEIIINLTCDMPDINLVTWPVKGDRVAQIVFVKYEPFDMVVVDKLSDTARGSGGFGSTGKK